VDRRRSREWKAAVLRLKDQPSSAGETYSREELKQIATRLTKDFCGLPSEFDKFSTKAIRQNRKGRKAAKNDEDKKEHPR